MLVPGHVIEPGFTGDPHETLGDAEGEAQPEPDIDVPQSRQRQQQDHSGPYGAKHHGHGALAGHESRHEGRRYQHRQVLHGRAEADERAAHTLLLQHQRKQRQAESVHQGGHTEHTADGNEISRAPGARLSRRRHPRRRIAFQARDRVARQGPRLAQRRAPSRSW